jgi:hypothetical protein
MEFDHRGEKSFTIGRDGKHVGEVLLRQEIRKCDVVCGNCHNVRTHKRKEELVHDSTA